MTVASNPSVYDFSARSIDGHDVPLAQYKDNVLLIVNTASKCGFTPQYAGLEQLYRQYKDRGLVVLGFPCNQFGAQEPGDEQDIVRFCELNYGVSFPMFAKIDVNGAETHPLYKFLKDQNGGLLGSIGLDAIKWNFTKFLVNRSGEVMKRYSPSTVPSDLASDIEPLLAN